MAGAIRQHIDIASLERYIEAHVPDIKTPVDVKQFGYGQSNPTYQLTDKNGQRYAMRKQPPGKLLSKTAHRVDREYKIIHALENTDVPVPKAYCLCEDNDVIGTTFYIMEFLDGRIFEDPSLPDVTSADRTAMWQDAVRTLGKLHRIDPKRHGLENYGKASGFYNRQINTFKTISEAQAKAVDVETKEPVGKIPHFDAVMAFFLAPETQPKDRSTLVHGDYKIDNLVFHKTEPRVIGILDWEMSTIGHPLSDVSNLLMPFAMAEIGWGNSSNTFKSGAVKGLPVKEQCMEWYRETAGWDPHPDMTWGDAFSMFRFSVIAQGIGARYALRQASSLKARDYGANTGPLGELAWGLVQKWKTDHERPKL